MTFESLMNQTLVLKRTTSGGRDEVGARTITTESSVSVQAYVYPVGGSEDRVSRNTQLGDWRAIVPPDADVDGWDRAEYDGREFDIVAPPEPIWNPRTVSRHHIRLRLQEIV